MKAESFTLKIVILLYAFSAVCITGLNARTTSQEYREGYNGLSNDSKSDGKGRSVAHGVMALCKCDSAEENADAPLCLDPRKPVNERIHHLILRLTTLQISKLN